MGNRRRSLISNNNRLPNEYQEVEFIRGTGTQYISLINIPLGYPGKGFGKTNIKCVARNSYAETISALFGTRETYNSKAYTIAITIGNRDIYNKNGIAFYYNNSFQYLNTSFDFTEFNTIEVNQGDLIVNGNTILSYDVSDFEVKHPFYLFGYTDGITSSYVKLIGTPDIKYFELTNQDTGANVQLISCYRKADNKPGMYDIINDVFYTNAGTGEFIVGPKV